MLGCDAINLLLVVGAALKDLLIYLVVVNLNKSGVNIIFWEKYLLLSAQSCEVILHMTSLASMVF